MLPNSQKDFFKLIKLAVKEAGREEKWVTEEKLEIKIEEKIKLLAKTEDVQKIDRRLVKYFDFLDKDYADTAKDVKRIKKFLNMKDLN